MITYTKGLTLIILGCTGILGSLFLGMLLEVMSPDEYYLVQALFVMIICLVSGLGGCILIFAGASFLLERR